RTATAPRQRDSVRRESARKSAHQCGQGRSRQALAKKTVLEQQLQQLDRLRERGTLTDAEYEARRRAIIASAPSLVSVKEGGSGAGGIFKWGFFGCLGIVAAFFGVLIVLGIIIAAAAG